MAVEMVEHQSFGSLVAVEGDRDVVSTQLQLLPSSSKILVMAPLMDEVPVSQNHVPFDARDFVRNVEQTLSSRAEAARSFLKASTIDQPRLVFMNGGSVNARLNCVQTIAEKLTDGNVNEAEELFQEIIKDGVAGLATEKKEDDTSKSIRDDQDLSGMEEEQLPEDPSSIAMKAADSLDRDTAGLQDSDEDEVEDNELLSASQTDSEYELEMQQTPKMEHSVFSKRNGDGTKTTVITISPHQDDEEHLHTFDTLPTSRTIYNDAMPYPSDFDLLSPTSRMSSVPPTPGLVEYGEAQLVEVKQTVIRRVNSVDRFPPRTPTGAQGAVIPSLKRSFSMQCLKTDNDLADNVYGHLCHSQSFEMLPRTTFVRACETLIRRPSETNSFSPKKGSPVRDIPQMTDAETQCPEPITETKPFEPVFALFEDLVIHFADGSNNDLFESIIRSYQDGSYPVVPSVSIDPPTTPDATISPSQIEKDSPMRPHSHITVETDDEGYHRRQEVDPFSPENYNNGNKMLWPSQKASKKFSQAPAAVQTKPPTPASTPPPVMSAMAQKFQRFCPINVSSPVGVQNTFRSILNLHFSPENSNYRQLTYADDTDRFWKPVFRNDHGAEGSNVDQIIAVGCEDGVNKGLFTSLLAQVSKLGTKKNGTSRNGTLDIRYLITTALASEAARSPTLMADPTLLTSPTRLATLLVPQIETYLSLNDTTRLLILTYPSQHLSIVLELRRLLGSELFRVAGIVDSSSVSTSTSKALQTSTTSTTSTNGQITSSTRSKRYSPTSSSTSSQALSPSHSLTSLSSPTLKKKPSFASADFLLPSTATDPETKSFLNSILKSLVSSDSFYLPEPEPAPAPLTAFAPPPIPMSSGLVNGRPKTPPGGVPSSKFAGGDRPKTPNDSSGTGSSRPNTPGRVVRPKTPVSASAAAVAAANYNPSSSSSASANGVPAGGAGGGVSMNGRIKGHLLTKSTVSQRERRSDKEWADFVITGEESQDEDFEARRLMPRVVSREMRRGNSRKALKFLGLA